MQKVASECKPLREDNRSTYEQYALRVLVLTTMDGDEVYSIRVILKHPIYNGFRRRGWRLPSFCVVGGCLFVPGDDLDDCLFNIEIVDPIHGSSTDSAFFDPLSWPAYYAVIW